MYGGVKRFGAYNFANLGKYSDNFADQKIQVIQLPGMDGGFDVDGDEEASSPPGKVTFDFQIISDGREGMTVLRDAVNLMKSYGRAKLVLQPTDIALPERWSWARLQTPKMNEDKGKHTDLWQPVSLTFSVPASVWWVDSYVNWSLGDGYTFGELEAGGFTIGGGGYEISASGTATTDVITTLGNAKTVPMVTVTPGTGQSCTNPKIQRLIGAVVIDEFAWTGTLSEGETLSIDGKTQQCMVGGTNIWADRPDYKHRDLMRLLPGDNTIRIVFDNPTDAATVSFSYRDSYR